jgi:arylformamidase
MAIDYEAEYNNRARVPEHPEIFARWEKDAAAYRDMMSREESAELGLKYGASARQTVDLFFPEASGRGPLAVFIHGGYWRSLNPGMFSHMAAGLVPRGVAVAVIGYDLCPQVSIAEIIAQTRNACLFLWKRFGQRLMVYGHSAGGHLAGAMLATDWRNLDRTAPPNLVPAAYSISGVFDLTPLIEISMNEELKLTPDSARAVSPIFWPAPKGHTLDAAVGALESDEFLRQSRIIADAWQKGGANVRYEALPGANHFTAVDPLTDTNSPMVERLTKLAQYCAKF